MDRRGGELIAPFGKREQLFVLAWIYGLGLIQWDLRALNGMLPKQVRNLPPPIVQVKLEPPRILTWRRDNKWVRLRPRKFSDQENFVPGS